MDQNTSMEAAWLALKNRCCADPPNAKMCVTVSREKFVEAMAEFLDTSDKDEEIHVLRTALIAAGIAAGAVLSDEVSTLFLTYVPDEIRAKIKQVTEQRDTFKKLVERAQIVSGPDLPDSWHEDANEALKPFHERTYRK